MDENTKQKCDHKWRKSGLWDGKTPDGQKTGGIMYKCDLCGEKASSLEEIKEKGGTEVDEKTDVYGKPISEDESQKPEES